MNTAQSTKNLAKQIARQMAQEPLEVLKTAREQATGEQTLEEPQEVRSEQKVEQKQNELQDRLKSERRVEALDRELKDMEKERVFKELQRKIAEGIEVYLEEYPELSMEQKQVLKAQIEAVQIRNSQSASPEPLQEPTSKKGRRLFNFGQKQAAERQTTRVEKPIPPSG